MLLCVQHSYLFIQELTHTHKHIDRNTQGHLDESTWQRAAAAADWPLSPPCDNKLELRPQDICINARHKYLCICSCICISPVYLCVSVLTALEQCGDRDLDVKLTALFSAFTARPFGLYVYLYNMDWRGGRNTVRSNCTYLQRDRSKSNAKLILS